MKKLGGMGRGSNHVTKMEYNNTTANSEEDVADLMAQCVEDTFQPLQEPDFDYTHFNHIEQEWLNSQFALDNSTPTPILPNTPRTIGDLNPFNITWPSPLLHNQPYQDHTTSDNTANPTKHQRESFKLRKSAIYKNKKDPLPPAHKPDIPVNHFWTENIMHTSPSFIQELTKAYEPFTISELEMVINKMK